MGRTVRAWSAPRRSGRWAHPLAEDPARVCSACTLAAPGSPRGSGGGCSRSLFWSPRGGEEGDKNREQSWGSTCWRWRSFSLHWWRPCLSFLVLKLLVGGYRAPGSFTKQAPGSPRVEKCVLRPCPPIPLQNLKQAGSQSNQRGSLLSWIAGVTESLANCSFSYLITIDVDLYSSKSLTFVS